MSANLKWTPSKHTGHDLPDALRFALEKNPSGNDRRHFGEASIPYLEGLRDAGIDGAQQLIDAIEKCGDVEVYWEY
jgi:hypothetical protein